MEAGPAPLQHRIAERFARTESAQSRRWLAFLAEASDVLAESLDYETTLSRIADLVVPELADWCSIDILDEGALWPVMLRHTEPERTAIGVQLVQRFPFHDEGTPGVWSAVRTGQPVLKPVLTDAELSAWATEPDMLELLRNLGLRSCIIVPLKAHGRVLGTLTCVTAESGVEYDEDDLVLVEELAGRCALALDNALLHSQLKQALAQKEEAVREREGLLRALELERSRLEAVLQQMPAGVLIVEPRTGRVLFANARADEVLGCSLMTEGLDRVLGLKGWHPDGREFPREEWPLVRSTMKGEMVHAQELHLERPDGTRQRLLCSSIPLYDAEGRWVAAVGTFENITAMREAEEQALRHARILEQFIGILGHDLRNPLQAISGSVQLLQRREQPEPARRAHQRIAGAAERMGRMITDLLDYTRSRLGGGIPLVPERVCLADLARQIAEELEVAHEGPKVVLDVCPDGWGVWDKDRIAQVIQNLVGNALQYGSADSPVRVTLRDEPEHVVLSVHNHGDAITPETLERLFEPFRRGNPGGGHSKGLGLGLYIARQIVLAHGGTVEVTSTTGDGTTFTVRLPRQPPANGAQLTA